MKASCSQLAFILVMVCLVLGGCRKEDPNPELKDPIYKDLKSRADSYKKEYEDAKVQVQALKEALAKVEPRSIERKDVLKDLAKAEAHLKGSDQLARYYKIRAERRRLTGRKAYRIAFQKGEEWPNPAEYSDYLVNIRLRQINLNWNARVPKLQDRIPAAATAKKESKSVEGEQ